MKKLICPIPVLELMISCYGEKNKYKRHLN